MRGTALAARIGGVVLVVVVVVAAWIGWWLWQGAGGERVDSIASWGSRTATGVATYQTDVLTVSYYREVYRIELSGSRKGTQLLAGRAGDDGSTQAADDGARAVGAPLRPTAVVTTGDGRTYIADGLTSSVRTLDQGQLRTIGRAAEVGGMAIDAQGANLYFSDRLAARVFKVGLQSGQVTPVAGTGTGGFAGDGGPAAQAQLSAPRGLAVDDAGSLYIADTGNQRIRKVDPNGTITTIAGNGQTGFGGDGGKATAATLSAPSAVAVDGAGNVYVADTGNRRIRELSGGGTIATFAGSGQAGADSPRAGVSARSAHLGDPTSLTATASGVVYVIDQFQLRKIENGQVTYVAPPGDPS